MNQTLEERITTAMLELGSTPDAVRDKLVAGGYTGYPGVGDSCPVAYYLLSKFGECDICIDQNTCMVDAGGYDVELVVPTPVSEFISKFDEYEYPELALGDLDDDFDDDYDDLYDDDLEWVSEDF